jgi:hypothetical protein
LVDQVFSSGFRVLRASSKEKKQKTAEHSHRTRQAERAVAGTKKEEEEKDEEIKKEDMDGP